MSRLVVFRTLAQIKREWYGRRAVAESALSCAGDVLSRRDAVKFLAGVAGGEDPVLAKLAEKSLALLKNEESR